MCLGGGGVENMVLGEVGGSLWLSGYGCGTGNGGRRLSQGEAAARAREGFTNLSPKLFQTTNRILKRFQLFFFLL